LILLTIRMIPHVIVLEPGLVVYKISDGYWLLGRPTLEDPSPKSWSRYQVSCGEYVAWPSQNIDFIMFEIAS
jgi:hypothetical protein